jgi:hypothetical protein
VLSYSNTIMEDLDYVNGVLEKKVTKKV